LDEWVNSDFELENPKNRSAYLVALINRNTPSIPE